MLNMLKPAARSQQVFELAVLQAGQVARD